MNNKGFAITSVIYGLAILGVMIVAILMGTLSSTRNNVAEEAKAVENFLINFNQTEVTYRSSSTYMVPQGETGWYRFEAFGKASASAKGAYTTGIIYLKEGNKIFITIGANTVIKDNNNKTIMIAGGASGASPGGTTKCLSKAPTGGYMDMSTFELVDTKPSLLGYTSAITFKSPGDSGCDNYSYILGYPNSEIGNNFDYFFYDGLMLPNAYEGSTGKVVIQRLAEQDEIVPTIPRKNTKFNGATSITVTNTNSELSSFKIRYLAHSKTESGGFLRGQVVECNSPCTVNANLWLDQVSIIFPTSDALKNSKNIVIKLGSNIIYDSRGTIGTGIGTEGIQISAYQPDSYVGNIMSVNNTFPNHGNYYILPVVAPNMAVSAVSNGADDANQLKIESLAGETRQRWAIDMIAAPGEANPNFSGIVNASGKKEYRIMELTRYKALNIYYDENYKMNFVSASETFNSLSRNEPQIWNVFPMKDGTYAIKTVVPSFTLSEKSGFLFAKAAGDTPNNINDVLIGKTGSQGANDRNTTPTSVERFFLYSLDFSR